MVEEDAEEEDVEEGEEDAEEGEAEVVTGVVIMGIIHIIDKNTLFILFVFVLETRTLVDEIVFQWIHGDIISLFHFRILFMCSILRMSPNFQTTSPSVSVNGAIPDMER